MKAEHSSETSEKVYQTMRPHIAKDSILLFGLIAPMILVMKAEHSFETSEVYQTTRPHIAEDSILLFGLIAPNVLKVELEKELKSSFIFTRYFGLLKLWVLELG
jgi:hypothetical protein